MDASRRSSSEDRMEERPASWEALGCDLMFLRAEQAQTNAWIFVVRRAAGAAEEDVPGFGCSMVIIDASLTPIQQRNLENVLV